MNQSVATKAVWAPLPSPLQNHLRNITHYREVFLRDFPDSAVPHNLAALGRKISERAGRLQGEWAIACNDGNLDLEQKGIWAQQVIERLDVHLDTRAQGKYYLPAWGEVYGLKCRLRQDLAESERSGRTLYFDDLGSKCCEIAFAAGYGLNSGPRFSVSQPLMGCLQSRLVEELERGVRLSLSSFGAREKQIVVLLQVLVQAAESGLLSDYDMLRMQGFVKMQTEMRPSYEGIDSAEGIYRGAISRQNILLSAALPFFQ